MDINIHTFVQKISGGESVDRRLCHYKRVPSLISIYHCLVAYKNLVGSKDMIVPTADINKSKITYTFNVSFIPDFEQFSKCVKKYCKSPIIQQNNKNNTIIVKV